MTKKVGEMTFKEFRVEVKKRGADEIIEDPNFGILIVLRREGFSDEQIDEMKMDKVWKLYLDSISVVLDQYMRLLSRGLKEKPEIEPIVAPHLEKLAEGLKKWIKEMEEQKKE